jgi:1,4-dihydroxy-2-naphthoate polyprenyltransferase
VNAYVEAARPRTLPAAVAPVLVGTAAAVTPVAEVSLVRAGLALVVALALQVAVNYANDYFDGVRGVDTEARIGPRRAVATGLISPGRMRVAIGVAMAVGAVAGLVLAALAGWELLLVGAVALVATLGYSGGPRPYASAGLGELVVFVFFGLVATAGSAYVQDERLTVLAVVVAIPVGAFAVALLVVNNLRDIPTDRDVGKVTLAVRLGEARTRGLFALLVLGAYATLVPLALLAGSPWLALPLLSVPAVWPGVALVRAAPLGPRLIQALGATARGQLLFSLLLAIALVLAEVTGDGGAGVGAAA